MSARVLCRVVWRTWLRRLRSCSAQPSASTAQMVSAAARRCVSWEDPADLQGTGAVQVTAVSRMGPVTKPNRMHGNCTCPADNAVSTKLLAAGQVLRSMHMLGRRCDAPMSRRPCCAAKTAPAAACSACPLQHLHYAEHTAAGGVAARRHSLHKVPDRGEDRCTAEVDGECVQGGGCHPVRGRLL